MHALGLELCWCFLMLYFPCKSPNLTCRYYPIHRAERVKSLVQGPTEVRDGGARFLLGSAFLYLRRLVPGSVSGLTIVLPYLWMTFARHSDTHEVPVCVLKIGCVHLPGTRDLQCLLCTSARFCTSSQVLTLQLETQAAPRGWCYRAQ